MKRNIKREEEGVKTECYMLTMKSGLLGAFLVCPDLVVVCFVIIELFNKSGGIFVGSSQVFSLELYPSHFTRYSYWTLCELNLLAKICSTII